MMSIRALVADELITLYFRYKIVPVQEGKPDHVISVQIRMEGTLRPLPHTSYLAACTSNTSGDTSGNTSGGDLTGLYWKLTSVDFNAQTSNLIVSQPDKYTVTFQTNGTANVKADCNTAALSYTTNGNQLTIKPGATTLVYCGEGSLSDRFLQALQSATSYSINNSELTIISKPDGTMTFKQG